MLNGRPDWPNRWTYAVPKPDFVWETLPTGTSICRLTDRLLVVRPDGEEPGTVRFAVLQELPANGGLLHLACGRRGTTGGAVAAAERAATLSRDAGRGTARSRRHVTERRRVRDGAMWTRDAC